MRAALLALILLLAVPLAGAAPAMTCSRVVPLVFVPATAVIVDAGLTTCDTNADGAPDLLLAGGTYGPLAYGVSGGARSFGPYLDAGASQGATLFVPEVGVVGVGASAGCVTLLDHAGCDRMGGAAGAYAPGAALSVAEDGMASGAGVGAGTYVGGGGMGVERHGGSILVCLATPAAFRCQAVSP